MRAELFTPAGRLAAVRPYAWGVTLTTGVPCDSFSLVTEELSGLEDVFRVDLRDDEYHLLFTGLVDQTRISDRTARLTGRGMAALLLDAEASPVRYDRVGWPALERRLLAPLGLSSTGGGGLPEKLDFAIESGMSHFAAVVGFIEGAKGVYPRFAGGSALNLAPAARPARPPVLNAGGALTLRRGGRIGEVLIRDRDSSRTLRVENPLGEKLSLHGRAVLTAVGRDGFAQMQRSALKMIALGEQGARTLTLDLPGDVGLRPCEFVSSGGSVWMVGECALSDAGAEYTLIGE